MPGGANFCGNRIAIQHVHDAGAGKTAFLIGDGPVPSGQRFGWNRYHLVAGLQHGDCNGLDTWASGDIIHLNVSGIETGVTVRFRPGANGNTVFLQSDQVSPRICDEGTDNVIYGRRPPIGVNSSSVQYSQG